MSNLDQNHRPPTGKTLAAEVISQGAVTNTLEEFVDAETPRRPPNAGKGRVAGVPNKVTSSVREIITDLLTGNREKAQGWLDKLGEKNPYRALVIYARLASMVLPRPTHAPAASVTVNVAASSSSNSSMTRDQARALIRNPSKGSPAQVTEAARVLQAAADAFTLPAASPTPAAPFQGVGADECRNRAPDLDGAA